MEGSICESPLKSGEEEAIISFGSFCLLKNGNFVIQPTMMQRKNSFSSSSSSSCFPSVKDHNFTDDTEKFSAAQVRVEEEIHRLPNNLDMEWPSQENIYNAWGMNLTENHHYGQEYPPINFQDNGLSHVPANPYGSPTLQLYDDSSIPAVSISNYLSNFYPSEEDHMMNGFRNFSPVMGSRFDYNPFSQIDNYRCLMNNNNTAYSSTHFSYQDVMKEGEVPQVSSLLQGNFISLMAKTRNGAEVLQRVLQLGNYVLTRGILFGVLESIFQLMIDDNGYHVIGMLVDKCPMNLLSLIVDLTYKEQDTFIHIAFFEKGSRSIQRFIKRIKKTGMVQVITSILSKCSYELLTHKIGSHVIRRCFLLLGEEPNLVFYETIFARLLDLAIDPVGCISLNNCIDTIKGLRRRTLLENLAAHSLFLSSDPSGNFVVQHILNLNNEDITMKILARLQGNFEHLAHKQGGSHVIENCIRSCPQGLNLVVKELAKNGEALYRITKNMFGNYVVQTALKETKMKDRKLYKELVEALRPYFSKLSENANGKHVAELIKEDVSIGS